MILLAIVNYRLDIKITNHQPTCLTLKKEAPLAYTAIESWRFPAGVLCITG